MQTCSKKNSCRTYIVCLFWIHASASVLPHTRAGSPRGDTWPSPSQSEHYIVTVTMFNFNISKYLGSSNPSQWDWILRLLQEALEKRQSPFVGVDKPQGCLARIAAWHHCHYLEITFSKQKGCGRKKKWNRKMEREITLIISFKNQAQARSVLWGNKFFIG